MRKTKPATPARRPMPRRLESARSPFELLGPEALGGVHARAGFRFQDLWIAFNLLDWVTQDDFRGFKNEGVDDVDVSLFQQGRRTEPFDSKYYQLKDTLVTPAVLSKVLD